MREGSARRIGCIGVVLGYALAIGALLLALCGCTTTKYVPVETVRVEYKDREVVRVDSVTMLDSVIVRSAGDTVLIEKWRWRDRASIVRDTVSVIKTDSVQVPYPVEKQLTKWEKAKMDFGGAAIGVCGAVLICIIVLIINKIRRKI